MRIKIIKDNYLEFDSGTVVKTISQDGLALVDFSYLETYKFNIRKQEPINIKEIDFNKQIENYITILNNKGISLMDKEGNSYFIPCYLSKGEAMAIGICNKNLINKDKKLFIINITARRRTN
jgi:hypothetical protein